MNYYNPYYGVVPYGNMIASAASKPGLFSNLIGGMKGIKWGSIITNTQRTLGIVNQAIPVIKQVTPIAKNAKTMFKVMNEFKKSDEPLKTNKRNSNNSNSNRTKVNQNTSNSTATYTNTPNEEAISSSNEPLFFI